MVDGADVRAAVELKNGTHTQTKGHKHSHAVMKTLLGQNRKVSQRAKEDTGAAESESPGSLR